MKERRAVREAPAPDAIIRPLTVGGRLRSSLGPRGESVASTEVLLFLSSCTTAVIHALIPDHWLPFVLISRSQRWTERRTIAMVALTGLVHVLVSLAVGALAMFLGTTSAQDLAQGVGTSLESMAGFLLVVFGLFYGIWAHRREARAHGVPRGGGEGEKTGHLHAHGHLLERWFRGAASGGALVAIIGISPCVLLQPILFAAAAHGPAAMTAAALGFAGCTLVTMVAVTFVATRGMRSIDLPFFTRYGDLISGVVIATIGLFVMLQES